MKEKAIVASMGNSLHTEIGIIGSRTLCIKSQCIILNPHIEEVIDMIEKECAKIESVGENIIKVTQVCNIPIETLQKMMSKLIQDSNGEYWFELNEEEEYDQEED